jgi:hypothetical protein
MELAEIRKRRGKKFIIAPRAGVCRRLQSARQAMAERVQ